MTIFQPECHALLIGSIPMSDHAAATRMMLEYTPDIPLWVQLPGLPQEGMIEQFAPGMPGLVRDNGRIYIDSRTDDFHTELASFYEDYLEALEDPDRLLTSRFSLSDDTARGFSVLCDIISNRSPAPRAIKGQIAGPVTMGIGLKDQDDRFVFYDDTLRDMLTKHLAMKAAWQIHRLAALGAPAIIFFDDPGLVSVGSSAYISISRDMVTSALAEVFTTAQGAGGLAGVHVCANADWSLVLESPADIISFDAYSYFDRFILFAAQVKAFMNRGGMLAWGIVPTGNAEDIERETTESLYERWITQARAVEELGVPRESLLAQSFITPSCGTGTLSLAHATRVLELTRDLSAKIRSEHGL
jgi:hypothetical protein